MERYKIIQRAGRRHLIIRWHDGERWRERSAGTARRRDAEKLAQKMRRDAMSKPSDDWSDFKRAFLADHHADLSKSYRAVFNTAAKQLVEITKIKRVTQVTPQLLARYRAGLREQGKSAATIATYLRHLRKAIHWAHEHGYIEERVAVKVPREASRMKGRPITREEFERMQQVERDGDYGQGFDRLLECLWFSGLRLSEACQLSWDDPRKFLVVNLDGRRPLLEIPNDKSGQARMLAIVPDFVEWLRAIQGPRTGLVCPLVSKHGNPLRSSDQAGRVISKIGEAAKVKTDDGHATAHDLRRSFATRWAPRVPPVVLKELMRHADIKTTLTYYVGTDAERTADQVWDAVQRLGGVLGGTASESRNSVSS